MRKVLSQSTFSRALRHISTNPQPVKALLYISVWLCLGYTIKPAWAAHRENQVDCLAGQAYELVRIQRVTDGDTVVLSDRRRVRIIGINSPELQVHHHELKLIADSARSYLNRLLTDHQDVLLFAGIGRKDQHNRLLAHIRLPTGEDVASLLLQRGLAAYSAVAPNTRCAEHFASLESLARQDKVGVWRSSNPWLNNGGKPEIDQSGFQIVTASVIGINADNKKPQLQLSNGIRLEIRNSIAHTLTLKSLLGQTIEVRGWISHRNHRPHLRLHHQTNLRIVN